MTHDKSIHILTEAETEKLIAQFDRESNVRRFSGIPNYIIKGLLLLFTLYVFWVTLIISIPEQIRRSAFLGILVFIGYLLYPIRRGMTKKENHVAWYDLVLGVLGAVSFFYYVVNFEDIIGRAALLLPQDIVFGVMGIIILAELCRRVVGLPILVVASGFIIYAFTAGFSLRRIVHQLFYTTDGIIGTPIGVCSTFIVLFIFLAAFLEKSGIASFFIDLANSVAGFASGGPAKVAVIASALEGMYSGSSVANTVGSGSVTIPVMKKTGYKPEFAAAVEAAASTGGQIMPPIMGAAAFLMSELTNIPYAVIAVSAILPALLYFTGIFLMIHFEAKKLGLRGLPKESIPHFWKLLLTRGYLFLPVIVLVALMSFGFTPAYAACFAILAALLVSMFRKDTRFTPASFLDALGSGSKNTIGVAMACAIAGIVVGIVSLTGLGQVLIAVLLSVANNSLFLALMSFGFTPAYAACFAILAALLVSMFRKDTRFTPASFLDALGSGSKNTIGVAMACAIAGIVVGIVSLTGLGQVLIAVLLSVANNSLFLALVLTMVACLILGMGIPTTANYVIMATITAPIVVRMGVPVLAAHMFVFYFGIVADITPPVALAAYAGAAIAKANPIKTGITATRLAITAFIIPYIFVFNPSMLFIDTTVFEVIRIVVSSCIGMFGLAIGLEGYMVKPINIIERLMAIAGGLLLIDPGLFSDLAGSILIVLVVLIQLIGAKRQKLASPEGGGQ